MFGFGQLFAQPAFELLRSVPAPEATRIATDLLQQVYTLNEEEVLRKYDNSGQLTFTYRNHTLGPLATIDATNPFNLLLYYPEFQTARILDRTLAINNEVNLWEFGFSDVAAIGSSNDNSLWLYDRARFRLFKIDARGNTLQRSDDLSLLLGLAPQPTQILARGERVWLNDPEHGLYLFDQFGQFIKSLPIPGITYFQVIDQRLYYRKAGKLMEYDLRAFSDREVELPEGVKAQHDIRLQKGRMFVLRDGRVEVYGW